MTYGSSASYTTSGGTSHVTIVLPGGATLFFDQTSWAPSGGANRCRLNYAADRNGNKINFSYANPLSTGNQSVMEWSSITDPYGHGITSASYTSSGYISVPNLLASVTFSDSRQVAYAYNSDNTRFCQAIAYTPAGAMSPSFSSSWYASGGTVTINDALLPSDNYGWQVLVDPSSYGRVRAMLRADHATYAYARP